MKLTGKTVKVSFETGYKFQLEYIADDKMKWISLADDALGSGETDHIYVKELSDDLISISWIESTGNSITHHINVTEGTVWAFMSWNDEEAFGKRHVLTHSGTFEILKNRKEETPMNNTEKAIALINTFATGDTEKAYELLAPDYIQHNLAFGTGADAFVDSVKGLAAAPVKTTVKTIRAFEDGDKVFLQNVVNFAGMGEQVTFDIFRFNAEGKIAEHWDNIANIAPANPSGHTQIDGATKITDLDKTEANRTLVKNFLYDVLQNHAPEKTPSYFNGDAYTQHNTGIADGLSGLGAALEVLGNQGIQMIYTTVHQVLAQGNFVLAVSEGTFGDAPTSYYDLFRIEDGKIAEHWDIMETIADESTWKHQNGKF